MSCCASRAFLVGALLIGSACGDDASLDRLRSELQFAPDEISTTAWIGLEREISLVLTNTGAARLHPRVESMQIDGSVAALGVSVAFDSALDSIDGGRSVTVIVTVAPQVELQDTDHTLELVLPVADDDVAPARATLALAVRALPPCQPSNSCEVATLNTETGACERSFLSDETPCDDESACTGVDRCFSGACIGQPLTCADDVACTVDSCDPERGCVFEPVNERCADGNPCTSDICSAQAGCQNPTSPDGTPCGPFSCAQFEVCSLGACLAWPTPEGFPCEDGDLCTVGDSCQAQQCAPGPLVEPSAQPPVTLERPTTTVDYELRWLQSEVATRPNTVPASIDVPLAFGSVLDLEQGLVGVTPQLVVVWKSVPFNVDGAPCDPWLPLYGSAVVDVANFCATAVVATFVDEGELRGAARGSVVGDSVVLHVAYGTVDAAFARRATDAIAPAAFALSIVESTYFPGPLDPARLMVEVDATVDLTERSAAVVNESWFYNTPIANLGANVHGGLRVLPGLQTDAPSAVVGWDMPALFGVMASLEGEAPDPGADDDDGGAQEPPPPPQITQTLSGVLEVPRTSDNDTLTWAPLRTESCEAAPAWTEEQSFHDVDLVWFGDEVHAMVLHNDGVNAGTCGAQDPTRLWLFRLRDVSSENPSGLEGVVSASLSSDSTLASLRMSEDDFCIPDGAGGCAPGRLMVDTSPFDHSNPVVTTVATHVGHLGGLGWRVAALAQGPTLGAVVAERDAFGFVSLELIDQLELADQPEPVPPMRLPSETFIGGDVPVKALRSPLSAQSVYAVTTGAVDDAAVGDPNEGVLVRFGCPFPEAPALP